MIDKSVFYGADRAHIGGEGAIYSTANPTNLKRGIARVWITVVGGNFDVNLPPANGNQAGRLGGPTFMLINPVTSTTITLKDAGGNTLATIESEKAALICLAANTTANGTWLVHKLDVA